MIAAVLLAVTAVALLPRTMTEAASKRTQIPAVLSRQETWAIFSCIPHTQGDTFKVVHPLKPPISRFQKPSVPPVNTQSGLSNRGSTISYHASTAAHR